MFLILYSRVPRPEQGPPRHSKQFPSVRGEECEETMETTVGLFIIGALLGAFTGFVLARWRAKTVLGSAFKGMISGGGFAAVVLMAGFIAILVHDFFW